MSETLMDRQKREQESAYISTTAAGAAADLSASRVHQLVKAGEIPGVRWGRRLLVERAGLQGWLEQRREMLGR